MTPDVPPADAHAPDLRVSVSCGLAQEHSSAGRFVFVYRVRIENHADESYKLMEREWRITDGRGDVTEVRGEGVVGEQPLLAPGAVYEYGSFATLTVVPGMMVGAYVFQDAWGARFRVPIPAFRLDVPGARVLN